MPRSQQAAPSKVDRRAKTLFQVIPTSLTDVVSSEKVDGVPYPAKLKVVQLAMALILLVLREVAVMRHRLGSDVCRVTRDNLQRVLVGLVEGVYGVGQVLPASRSGSKQGRISDLR